MAIKVIGVGHHPFSKKYEFKGFFDDLVPCLIATDYKAPKTVLELHYDGETEETELTNVKSTQVYEKKSFTYASAFAGIGGMTLGLKPLGGEGVIAWEYDPTEKRRQYAQDAHKLLHPEIPIHGDICEADTDELPDFDVFCFTPPCQAFSVAGKRGGFDDTRGTLTFEALRIAKSKKPKILFMENVKGLVNHDKGNTMGTIIHAINEIGYTVDFTVLNSKYFDVAQNRERVYLIAIRDDLITPEPWNDVKGTTMLPKAKRRYQEEGAKTFNFDWPEQTEVRTRLRDFLEHIVDEKYYIDEDKTAKLVVQLEEKTNGCAQDIVERVGNVNPSGNGMNGNVYSIDAGLSPTLTTNKGEGIKMLDEVRPVLTPERIEKRQNGRRFKEDGEESFTLTSIDRHGVAVGEYPKYRIRKLTPRECLRLQSVPEDVIDALSTQFSDSRLYKFAGNGLTTNVITAIGERLIKYL